jgi:MFS family permease
VARFVQGFANALTQPSSQSIILIYYSGNVTRAISLMEISGAIGAAAGPFLGSSLNLAFGYEGPFIFFATIYLAMFYLLYRYIPSDQKT